MIKVEKSKIFDSKLFFSVIQSSIYKPYRSYPGVVDQDVNKYILNQFQVFDSAQTTEVFTAIENDKVVGVASFSYLPWDSQLFDIRMGTIKHLFVDRTHARQLDILTSLVSNIVDWSKEQKYSFVLKKVNTDDLVSIRSLENNKFLWVDTLLDYVYDPIKKPFTSLAQPVLLGDGKIRLACKDDENSLKEIAYAAFKNHFGRFHSDPNIPREKAINVYVEWICSSLNGYDDFITLLEMENRIVAFCTWRYPSSQEVNNSIHVGHLSLVAVHPDFTKMGLFYTVTYEGMRRMVTKITSIETATHINNYPAQRGFTRLGWQIYDAHHAYHLWL